MRYFPAPLSRAGSDALAEKAMKDYEAEGFSYLPVEVKDGARFIHDAIRPKNRSRENRNFRGKCNTKSGDGKVVCATVLSVAADGC